MTIAIDWPNKVITIPKADLTFVSGTLYELDTDWFRLQLKDLEDDEAGMPWPDTHRHNSEVTVAGTTYAQVIEMINGYRVQFEDQGHPGYTVRLAGSNNNLFAEEVIITNHNSVIGQNSAGLIAGDISVLIDKASLESPLIVFVNGVPYVKIVDPDLYG